MEDFFDFLVPICICVVLPVTIVWLVTRARQNETNRKTEIMLKAIEAGAVIDADFFNKATKQQSKTIKEKLLSRLTAACVLTLMGIIFIAREILLTTGSCQDEGPHMVLPLAGGILLAIGIAQFIVYFIGKKMLSKEIEAEEKSLGTPKE